MPSIRLLLAGPQLIADLIEGLIGAMPDITIVGKIPADAALPHHARESRADVVVLGSTDETVSSQIDDVLFEVPTIKLFALAPDWRSAAMHELRPHATPVPDLSRDALLDAIRTAVSHAHRTRVAMTGARGDAC